MSSNVSDINLWSREIGYIQSKIKENYPMCVGKPISCSVKGRVTCNDQINREANDAFIMIKDGSSLEPSDVPYLVNVCALLVNKLERYRMVRIFDLNVINKFYQNLA